MAKTTSEAPTILSLRNRNRSVVLTYVAWVFFVDNIPSFINWARYLSPFKYAFDASQQLIFDRNVPCDGSGILQGFCEDNPNGFVTPDEMRDFLNVNGSVGFNVGLLLVLIIVPRYIAYLALKVKKGGERS